MPKAISIEVKYGDRFRAGPHFFQCGDILVPGEWESLLKAWRQHSRKPLKWVYSDPPWSAGNLGYWRTHAGCNHGPQDYGRFCERFAECVGMIEPDAVYVENSVSNPDTMILAASRQSLWPNLSGRWTVRYGSLIDSLGGRIRRPNLLLRFAAYPWNGNPSEMANQAMTEHVFDMEPCAAEKKPVADLCVGLGMTVRVAHARHIPCLGNELNPKRLARTLGWLADLGIEVIRL